jgi:hypothetical protein
MLLLEQEGRGEGRERKVADGGNGKMEGGYG